MRDKESHIINITPEIERRVLAERRADVRDQLAAKDREITRLRSEVARLEAKIIDQSEAMAEFRYQCEHGLLPGHDPS